MADTQTTNYKLTKPQNAGSDDTWGDKLNANFDAIDAQMKATADLVAPGVEPARQMTTGQLHLLGCAVPSAATLVLVASTIYFIPVCQTLIATGLTCKKSSTSYGVGAAARISLYESDARGMPSTLAETLGSLNLAGPASDPTVNFAAARTLKPSQWVAFHTNGSVAGAATQICGVADPIESSRLFGIVGSGTPVFTTPSDTMGLSKALAFGTLAADPFPTAGLAIAAAVPQLWAIAS